LSYSSSQALTVEIMRKGYDGLIRQDHVIPQSGCLSPLWAAQLSVCHHEIVGKVMFHVACLHQHPVHLMEKDTKEKVTRKYVFTILIYQ